MLITTAAFSVWEFDVFVANLTCQSKKIASNVGKEGIFCSTKVTKQQIAEKKDSTSEIESSHVTLVFYCCGLECREPSESRQEACLLT